MSRLKILLFLTVVWGASFVSLGTASAHTVQKTGTMKVTLHIEPNDKPVTGSPQTIDFIFSDSSKKFDTGNCSCIVSVQFGGKQIYTASLVVSDPILASMQYTFTDAGNYHVVLNATPRAGSTFKPFSVTFDDITVESGQTQGTKIIVGLALALAIAVPGLFILSYLLTK